MNNSLINAMVSLQGMQQKIDIISHNMANVNTTGYKQRSAVFEDLLTSTQRHPDPYVMPGRMTPAGMNIGWGSRVSQIQINMEQGSLISTGQELDLAIDGNALFGVGLVGEDGEIVGNAWTRNGAFHLSVIEEDPDNLMLTSAEGQPVLDVEGNRILIPVNHQVLIDSQGNIVASPKGDGDGNITIGQLMLAQVVRPQFLQSVGDNLLVVSPDADEAEVLRDVDFEAIGEGQVAVRQGYLEGSNVNLQTEMTELIQAQRAYQMAARAITSSDNLMNLANNLRG